MSERPSSSAIRFDDEDGASALAASAAMGATFSSGDVSVPDALESLLVADAFGLVFVDSGGSLSGWIEPTDADPTVWSLFLLPGYGYPPGHGPDDPGGTAR